MWQLDTLAQNWNFFYIFVDKPLSSLLHSHLCLTELDCNIMFCKWAYLTHN